MIPPSTARSSIQGRPPLGWGRLGAAGAGWPPTPRQGRAARPSSPLSGSGRRFRHRPPRSTRERTARKAARGGCGSTSTRFSPAPRATHCGPRAGRRQGRGPVGPSRPGRAADTSQHYRQQHRDDHHDRHLKHGLLRPWAGEPRSGSGLRLPRDPYYNHGLSAGAARDPKASSRARPGQSLCHGLRGAAGGELRSTNDGPLR
jgi:hypothetical protein